VLVVVDDITLGFGVDQGPGEQHGKTPDRPDQQLHASRAQVPAVEEVRDDALGSDEKLGEVPALGRL